MIDPRPTPLLAMRGIVKTFPGAKALNGVSLHVMAGEIHAICGENGAGKSTLMKILSGVYPHGAFEGDILLRGEPVTFKDIRASEAAGIAIIHQELALIPALSITENLFLGHEIARAGVIDWTQAQAQARGLLERVGLREDPDTAIQHLGVGKQQLVEIAKALGKSARLLILDEPTAALNEDDSAHLLTLLRDLRAQGMTCILISHKLNEVLASADAITILRDGQSIETLRLTGDQTEPVNEDRLIRAMVGRSLGVRFPARSSPIGASFFEVRDWTVRHPQNPERRVCKGIGFSVRRGEILGFAGLMGAGRTELALSLFGRSYGIHERGQILMNGQALHLPTVAAAIHHGIAYVTEDRKTLGLNLLDDIKTTTVAANLGRISRHGVIDREREVAVAEDYRRSLRIKTSSVNACVGQLSGGNQQKVILAKWLFTEPELLILDEPTRGIDVGAKQEIYALIRQLAAKGKGVILISSELPELLGLADRIHTLCEGAITGELERDQASQERLMRLMTVNQ
ncbi:Xylose import ATP-binding protein XylG [Thiorhodovibrio winogradskyi]|uniref:Xylose import ATP-binding protein XylG n=1 Tax=Thiorhodovibrio winogradskyi TaxID=77007 RepID=A0ABZ0SFS1_9GAMM|nr:sugar ABC transporter ATP-binding protein [Thiorhodovibrio winogradskyi]